TQARQVEYHVPRSCLDHFPFDLVADIFGKVVVEFAGKSCDKGGSPVSELYIQYHPSENSFALLYYSLRARNFLHRKMAIFVMWPGFLLHITTAFSPLHRSSCLSARAVRPCVFQLSCRASSACG